MAGRFVPGRWGVYCPRPVLKFAGTHSGRLIGLCACAGLALAFAPMADGQPLQDPPRNDAAPPKPEVDPGPKTPPSPDLELYEGRVIRSVEFRKPVKVKKGEKAPAEPQYEGVSEDIAQLIQNQLRSKAGGAYQQSTVSGDITRLNRVGRFKTVESRVQLLEDGTVNLIYTVIEQPVIQDVQVVGNRQLSDQEIGAAVDVLKSTPVDRYQLDNASRRIEDLYRKKGYYLAQVTVDEKELEESGIVLFKIREGERVKVTDIRFEGNLAFLARELRTAIKTKEYFPIFEKGPLDDQVLQEDVSALVSFYRDRGYLDVRVDKAIRPSPNGREAIVTFIVDEGPVYTYRNLLVLYSSGEERDFKSEAEALKDLKEGEVILRTGRDSYVVYRYGQFTPEQITGLMLMKPGDVYSVDKLEKSLNSLVEAYAKLGYTIRRSGRDISPSDGQIRTRELRDDASPKVDLLLIIREGEKFKIGEVIVQGNELTKQNVVQRQLGDVKPERPLDQSAIDYAAKKLRGLNLFERQTSPQDLGVKVRVQDPDPLEPDHRDVLVQVEETNTGSLSFGAAVSSDAGLVGRIALNQRNFDIADTPDSFGEFVQGRSFRGAGQSFQAEALPGTKVQTYSLSLSDPYFLETDYSAGATAFYRKRDYTEYDEERYGGRFSFGRRLGDRWSASVPLRLESINLSNIEPDKPEDVFAVEDPHTLTSIGLTLARSSLDDEIRPSKGTKIEVGVDQVGALGGDFTYNVLRAEHQIFFKLNEDFMGRKTVLSFNTRASYIPQGNAEAPVYERFYLGGQNFRGFNFRGVSPVGIRNDTKTLGDDAVGGSWMFFWGAQINQPILDETFSLVGFIDTGTVSKDVGFDEYRVSVGFGIRLYIPQLSQAPLAFDFGFPLVREDFDRERVFSFSVDLPFQ